MIGSRGVLSECDFPYNVHLSKHFEDLAFGKFLEQKMSHKQWRQMEMKTRLRELEAMGFCVSITDRNFN